MKKILVINGPNLNMVGLREPALYGNRTYKDLCKYVKTAANGLGIKVKLFQSNSEGAIVTKIQRARGKFDGIVINAGAYTHTSLAILDALKAAEVPAAEVHLTDIHGREEYRKFSYVQQYAFVQICGKGFEGYGEALAAFTEKA